MRGHNICFHRELTKYAVLIETLKYTVKTVLVATSIKQATFIKQACLQFPEDAKLTEILSMYQECIGRLRKSGGQKINFILLLLHKFS